LSDIKRLKLGAPPKCTCEFSAQTSFTLRKEKARFCSCLTPEKVLQGERQETGING
jgi:hypothetical protein